MDIHKPKPWRGWPEFLKEIGTIVIGVLIALGAEQGVEWLHWRHAVAEQRAAMNGELSGMVSHMRARAALAPCIQRRLQDIQVILSRHDAGEPIRLTGSVGRPFSASQSDSSWQIAVANQSLGHMALEEQHRFAEAYHAFRSYDQDRYLERDIWVALQPLNDAARLDPQEWPGLRRAYYQAVDLNSVLQSNLGSDEGLWMRAFAGVRAESAPDASGRPQVQALCSPLIAR